MKRKTLLITCSLLMIVAALVGVLTACTATTTTTTTTSTTTTTAAPATTTVTTTVPGTTVTLPAETTTVITTGVATTSTVTVSATETVTVVSQPVLSNVLNPALSPVYVARLALTTPRPTTLAGKIIYVVGDGWGGPDGGDRVLSQILVPWLQKTYPTADVRFRYKAGSYMTDDPALWAEIEAQVPNAVCIVGISG